MEEVEQPVPMGACGSSVGERESVRRSACARDTIRSPALLAIASRQFVIRFLTLAGLLTLGFAWPLGELIRFAVGSSLFSHVLLVPWVSLYLIVLGRGRLSAASSGFSSGALLAVLAGGALLVAFWVFWRSDPGLPAIDRLAVLTTAYVLLLVGVAWLCLGTAVIRAWAFPLGFLAFMIPWPTAMIDAVEIGLQYASAEVAAGLLRVAGLPFVRDGQVFELPGIVIQVAQECSGIRSSYVLLITSLVAGQVLLRTPWKRWVLALAVVPLGILRNGLRILTLASLCVHVSPEMIHSPIHHRGGPVFFVLSLVPLFALLYWLQRSERRAGFGRVPAAGS